MNVLWQYIYDFFVIATIICCYNFLDVKYFKTRSFLIFFIIDNIFTILNSIFYVDYSIYYIIQSVVLLYVCIGKLYSDMKSDEILDNDNVYLIFYKPKSLKQFLFSIFGFSYSSAGLVINKNIYQMRYEKETLQEIPFTADTKDYLKEKYLIIDTGFSYKKLKKNWRLELLSQNARQKYTWNRRFNCLRSLSCVLNCIPNFEYDFEYIFPMFYLFELKIKQLIRKWIGKAVN